MGRYPALDLRYQPASPASRLEDLVYATLDDLEPTAIQDHESAGGWRIFFRTGAQRDRAAAVFSSVLGPSLTSIAPIDVDDENWAERSQASLKAVRVGRFIVAPPWEANAATGGVGTDALIVISPSMGFGTGHHATTRLCLQLLQQVPLEGRCVIDVGTGSGVLAIAAWRLGAKSVLALDYDPDAIENARENVSLNLATISIEVREADLASVDVDPVDVVTANLTAAVIQKHAERLRGLVRAGGHLILSGFGPDELPGIVAALATTAYQTVTEDEWAAMAVGV